MTIPNNDRLILDVSYEIEHDILAYPAYFPTPLARQAEAEHLRRNSLFRVGVGLTREQLAEAYALAVTRHNQRPQPLADLAGEKVAS